MTLEGRAYYLRRVGTDGFRIGYQPTLKKVVNDRRASLDPESQVKPAVQGAVKGEFDRGRTIPWTPLPADGSEVPDAPKLSLVVLDPSFEYRASDTALRQKLAEWTKLRGTSPRSYPAALVWCIKKPGRELTQKIEEQLAWRRVKREIDEGTLGGEFEKADRLELVAKVKEAEDAVADEVWASYRFIAIADATESDGIRVIDLGAGHASGGTTLTGRVIEALKAESLLNESVGAGYIDRNWPPALKAAGAWPMAGLRQSFLNGSLTRLLDPDTVLKGKVCEFVARGDFGLGSNQRPDATFDRVWFEGDVDPAEVTFDKDLFLLTKAKAKALRMPPVPTPEPGPFPESPSPAPAPRPDLEPEPSAPTAAPTTSVVRVSGSIPPESWNRFGMKVLAKMRAGKEVKVTVDFTATFEAAASQGVVVELAQALQELGVEKDVAVKGAAQ
jgi:hypothetical protein